MSAIPPIRILASNWRANSILQNESHARHCARSRGPSSSELFFREASLPSFVAGGAIVPGSRVRPARRRRAQQAIRY